MPTAPPPKGTAPSDLRCASFKDAFAGTLSPTLMDSRTDGALSEVRLLSATSIEVVFLRYVSTDPLCCPSRLTTVRYRIERRGNVPVVVPLFATSKPSR